MPTTLQRLDESIENGEKNIEMLTPTALSMLNSPNPMLQPEKVMGIILPIYFHNPQKVCIFANH